MLVVFGFGRFLGVFENVGCFWFWSFFWVFLKMLFFFGFGRFLGVFENVIFFWFWSFFGCF